MWFRRGRRAIFAPLFCHFSGWFGSLASTYLAVRISESTSLIESGEILSGIEELQTAARQAPEFPQTHFLLAEAYRRANNKVLASKEMEEFQRLDRERESQYIEANTRK